MTDAFDAILINNSCKYFLHLQLFSEYEEVLNELSKYMSRKQLSKGDFKMDIKDDIISKGTDNASNTDPKLRLFTNKSLKNDLGQIVWENMMEGDNKTIFKQFIENYFDIDLNDTPLFILNPKQYEDMILREYVLDMINIYNKDKEHEDRKAIKDKYFLNKTNDMSGFINAIVNIVLYCKLKKQYTQEEDCYNELMFDRIIQDFTNKAINARNADDKIIKNKLNDEDFSETIKHIRKKREGKSSSNLKNYKIKTKETQTILNKLLEKANEKNKEDRLDAKKKLIKSLKNIFKPEDLSFHISEIAHQKLMAFCMELNKQNIKKNDSNNLVSYIESIFNDISEQKEEPKKMTRKEFYQEFYDRYNFNNFINIDQLLEYCLDIVKSSKLTNELQKLLTKYGDKYNTNLETFKNFFTKLQKMYDIKNQNYPQDSQLREGSSSDEFKNYLIKIRNEFIRNENSKLNRYMAQYAGIFETEKIEEDLTNWQKIEKRIKDKINVINWILLYQSRLDSYIHGGQAGYSELVKKVNDILERNTASSKLFNQYKNNIQLKVNNINPIRGLYETIGWSQYTPEDGSDLLTENYYLYKTFAVANDALITKLTTKQEIEVKEEDEDAEKMGKSKSGRKRSNYRNFYDHATEKHIQEMILESIPKDQAHDFVDGDRGVVTGEFGGDTFGLALSMSIGRVQNGNKLPQLQDYMTKKIEGPATEVMNKISNLEHGENLINKLYEGYHSTTKAVTSHGHEIAHAGEQVLYKKSQNRFFMNVRAIKGRELEDELNTRENMIWSPEPLYEVSLVPTWNAVTNRIGSTLPNVGNPGYHKFLNFLEPYFDSSNDNGEIHQWFWERKSLDKPDLFKSTSYKSYGNRMYNIWKGMKDIDRQKQWIKMNKKLLLEYFTNRRTRVDRKLRFLQIDAKKRPSAYNIVYNQKRDILLGNANKGDDILTILTTAGKSDQSPARVGEFFDTPEYFSNPIINPGTGHTAYKNITYMESAQNTNKTVIPLTNWSDEEELFKERMRSVLLYCEKMYKKEGEKRYKKYIGYDNANGFLALIYTLSPVELKVNINVAQMKEMLKKLIPELKMEGHFINKEIKDDKYPVKYNSKFIINKVNVIEQIGEKVSLLVEQIPTKNKNVDGIYHLNDMYEEYLNYMGGEIALYKICSTKEWAENKNLLELHQKFNDLKKGDTKKGVIYYVYDKKLQDSAVKFCDIIVDKKEIYQHIPSDLIEDEKKKIEKDSTVKFYPGYNNIRNEYRQECIFRSNASWKIKFIKEKYRIMKIKKMLAREDEDIWNIETYNFLEKELNRLNRDSTDNTIGYNYNFKKEYNISKAENMKQKNFIYNSMSEKIYSRISEMKKELDEDLSNNISKTVKYYPFYIEKESEQPAEKKAMKKLLGDKYVRSGEVEKVLEGRVIYDIFNSPFTGKEYFKSVEKDNYLSGLIAFNLSFKEAKNDKAKDQIILKEQELTNCVKSIIENNQNREKLKSDTWEEITQNPYNWFCKADKMIEMSKYRGLFLNNSGYRHSDEVVITPLDKIFVQIALSDFYSDKDDDGGLIIKTSVLPDIKRGNTSWMHNNILSALADDNKEIGEAFQKVEQRLSLLYKGYTESVADKPEYRLVTGTYRRVGNDMTDEPSVSYCTFNYRIRAPITLFLLMALCKKNKIEMGDHIGKIKLYNDELFKSVTQHKWLLSIYEDKKSSSQTKKYAEKVKKAMEDYKKIVDEKKKIEGWIGIIEEGKVATKKYKMVVENLKKKTKDARLKEIEKMLERKDNDFSIEHYIKSCIMSPTGLELPYLEECLPQIIRQITELGRKIEERGDVVNLNMEEIEYNQQIKEYHNLSTRKYPLEEEATHDKLKSALAYTSDDIYQKLYRFLGYGYEKEKDIINVNDILFYLCCPLYQKSFSDFMQWEQGDFLQNMYSPNRYGIQNITLTGTNDTFAAFAGLCSICSPTLFEREVPKKDKKSQSELGKTPTIMFSCALERNTRYPMWLYITHYKVFKDNEGKETMLLGSVPLSDPKYNKEDYYRKSKIDTLSKKLNASVTDKISYKGEGVLYKENDKCYYNLSCVSIGVLNKIIEIIIELKFDNDFNKDDFLITDDNNEITNPDDMFDDQKVENIDFINNFINIKMSKEMKWEMHIPKKRKIVGVSNKFVEKHFADIDDFARNTSQEIIIENNFGIILEKVAHWKREYKNILKFYEICEKNWENFVDILSAYGNTVGGINSQGKANLTQSDIDNFKDKNKLQANPKDKSDKKIKHVLDWLRSPKTAGNQSITQLVRRTDDGASTINLSNKTPSSGNKKHYDEVHFWFEGDAWNGLGLAMNTWRRTMRDKSVFFRYFPFCKPMSEYENFEEFLKQLNEIMNERRITVIQYGGAGGPATEWVKGKQYIKKEKVFIIEDGIKKYYRYDPEYPPQPIDLQTPPDASDLWREIDKEEGEDDDASTEGSSMSEDDTEMIVDKNEIREPIVEIPKDNDKLKTDISETFDKILKLEEKKQVINNLITKQEKVDNVLEEINEIKKDIKLPKKEVYKPIEKVVEEEEVNWKELSVRSEENIIVESEEGEGDLLEILSKSLEEFDTDKFEAEMELEGNAMMDAEDNVMLDTDTSMFSILSEQEDPTLVRSASRSSYTQTFITGDYLDSLADIVDTTAAQKPDRIKNLKISILKTQKSDLWEKTKRTLAGAQKSNLDDDVLKEIELNARKEYYEAIYEVQSAIEVEEGDYNYLIKEVNKRLEENKRKRPTEDEGDQVTNWQRTEDKLEKTLSGFLEKKRKRVVVSNLLQSVIEDTSSSASLEMLGTPDKKSKSSPSTGLKKPSARKTSDKEIEYDYYRFLSGLEDLSYSERLRKRKQLDVIMKAMRDKRGLVEADKASQEINELVLLEKKAQTAAGFSSKDMERMEELSKKYKHVKPPKKTRDRSLSEASMALSKLTSGVSSSDEEIESNLKPPPLPSPGLGSSSQKGGGKKKRKNRTLKKKRNKFLVYLEGLYG